jgi:lincosamide nucleotidyltransferase A/C/D/E
MPAAAALDLLAALNLNGVRVCVGGGWAVDALLGEQTRPHSDLDLWIPAADAEPVFNTLVGHGIDRIHPWPGDRPWNFVMDDARARRVDLHFYEHLDAERLHYGSVTDPFLFSAADLAGSGSIASQHVRCESPQFAVRCHTGYAPRDPDRHDVAALCTKFNLTTPEEYLN